MIRFLQTPGPLKKIILGGLLLIICGAMVVTLVPWGSTGFGLTGPEKGVVAMVGGENITTTEVPLGRCCNSNFPAARRKLPCCFHILPLRLLRV